MWFWWHLIALHLFTQFCLSKVLRVYISQYTYKKTLQYNLKCIFQCASALKDICILYLQPCIKTVCCCGIFFYAFYIFVSAFYYFSLQNLTKRKHSFMYLNKKRVQCYASFYVYGYFISQQLWLLLQKPASILET